MKKNSAKEPRNRKPSQRRALCIERVEKRELMAADLAGVFRGANQWYMDLDRDPAAEIDRSYGLSGDRPVAGKWTGTSDMTGVVRPMGDGLLHWLLDTNGDPNHDVDIAFGLPGDEPVVGDWDGDGRDNVGVTRRGSDGLVRWLLDTDGDPSPEQEFRFGLNGDRPVPGDWDGDGRDNLGVVRPMADGLLHWFYDLNGDIWAEQEHGFGLHNDRPIAGDWDGDGRDNMGVTRPGSDGLLHWLVDSDNDPAAEIEWAYGLVGDVPVAGDWKFGEIEVVGAANNPLGQYPSIEIGRVQLNSTDVLSYSFRVRNTGNVPLSGSASLTGAFTITDDFTSPIPAGGEELITLRLNSNAQGGRFDGMLRIDNADGGESPYFVRFHAIVWSDFGNPSPSPSQPEVDVVGIADGQSAQVSFGSATIGQSVVKEFTVRNIGSATLTLQPVTVTGSFSVVRQLPASLASNGSATFQIAMNTATAGQKTGTVAFVNNDSNESPYNFNIVGNVTNVVPSTAEIDVVGIPDGQTQPVSFGTALTGATVTREFVVRNLGAASLRIDSVTVTGDFQIVQNLPTSIAANGSAVLKISMRTATAGTKNGAVRIANNDTNENPYDFALTGVVATREAEVEVVGITDGQSSPVSFGVALSSETVIKSFTVRNLGNDTLRMEPIKTSGNFKVVQDVPATLAANGSATFRVQMLTGAPGEQNGTISFRTNDANEGTFNFPVSGRVIAVTSNRGTVISWQRAISDSGTVFIKQVQTTSSQTNSHRLFADFYSPSGASLRTDVPIGDHAIFGNHVTPRIAALNNGRFAIAWINNNGTTSGGVRYTLVDAYGSIIGARDRKANITFSSNFALNGIQPVSSTGGFIISWTDLTTGKAKRREFNMSGTAVTGEL